MGRFEEIVGCLSEWNPDAVLFDGFENALIGVMQRFSQSGHVLVALYDREACLRILMERDGMSYEGAIDCFEYNTVGCHAGEHTPAIATLWRDNGSR